ncbi:MAG TPA: response regulator [Anaeromyxobacteraceae bacterium]|nr:response regulator [Anaeromyxobacteraceae bacterium]
MRGSCRVLVVDDDAGDRRMVERALSARGYPVQVAANGREALARIDAEGVPRLVVLDLLMPEMDGAEFLAALRDRGIRDAMRVVLVTAVASRHLLGLLGAEAALFKPVAVQDLIRAVDGLCPGDPGPP